MVGGVSKTAQDVGMVWAYVVLFPSGLVPFLHVLVFSKKTFLCLVVIYPSLEVLFYIGVVARYQCVNYLWMQVLYSCVDYAFFLFVGIIEGGGGEVMATCFDLWGWG